jgi:hypothetical protein
MKLKDCIELARACDLDNLDEALYNVTLHRGNLFVYTEIDDEIEELYQEVKVMIEPIPEPSKLQDITLTYVEAWLGDNGKQKEMN